MPVNIGPVNIGAINIGLADEKLEDIWERLGLWFSILLVSLRAVEMSTGH